jgi:hypothetical protein
MRQAGHGRSCLAAIRLVILYVGRDSATAYVPAGRCAVPRLAPKRPEKGEDERKNIPCIIVPMNQ